MDILLLVPAISGNSSILGNDYLTTHYSDGLTRTRRQQRGTVDKVACSFVLKKEEFRYLMAFWRLNRAQEFALRVHTKTSQLRWHACNFIDVPNWKYEGAGNFIVNLSVFANRVIKLKPPLKYASRLYPIGLRDSIALSTEIDGESYLYKPFRDSIAVSASFEGNSIVRSKILPDTFVTDNFALSASFEGNSTVRSIVLPDYNMDKDELSLSASFEGNSAVKTVIIPDYSMDKDELSLSASFEGNSTVA